MFTERCTARMAAARYQAKPAFSEGQWVLGGAGGRANSDVDPACGAGREASPPAAAASSGRADLTLPDLVRPERAAKAPVKRGA